MTMTPRSSTLFISNIAWDFVWQRHQSLASLFARDRDVVFCEIPGIRRVGVGDLARIWNRFRTLQALRPSSASIPDGIRIVRPFVVPATNRLFHHFNASRIRQWLARETNLMQGVELVVNYSPARTALQLIERVPHRQLLYDCTDNWLAVRGIPGCLPGDEHALLRRADLTTVPSRELENAKRPYARRLARLPHGAFVERFILGPKQRSTEESLTLLYYGHLHAQHLDFAAIVAVARAKPTWRILLVGPVKTRHIFPANVELCGQQPHERLRDSIRQADVLLLPYALNDYTRSVLPAKTYECLATGRPIVAAPLPELVADFAAFMTFAERPAAWVPAIERALSTHTADASDKRIELARSNTWEARYAQLRALLSAAAAPSPPAR